MTEVALAFSNIDKPRADALARILNAVGYEVAAQPLTPEKIERASAVLAFWSPSSINSQPVQNFASQAAYAKKLVSVRAGPADPPAAFALVTLHDLSSWTGSLDAPELRTLVSHVAKMAPPPQQQPQPARNVGFGGNSFAGNGFDPYGRSVPPTSPQPAAPQSAAYEPAPQQPVARQPEPKREAAPAPVSYRDRPTRPERRAAEEPRRAAGGGVARMAFGAIAVTVMGGGAVAAFNYYEDGKANTADAPSGAEVLTAQPSAPIAAPPATTAEAPTSDEGVQVAANTYATPATTAVAAPTVAAEAPVTVQSRNGWTASLPSTPPSASANTRTPTMTATPVSGGAARPARPQQPGRLPPITTSPQPTDIVAVDRANFGEQEAKPAPAPAATNERVWQRPDVTYGPDS